MEVAMLRASRSLVLHYGSILLVNSTAAAFSTMMGGIIRDIYYHSEHRNVPILCFSGAVLLGTGLGRLIPGFINYGAKWHWIHYSQAIAFAVLLTSVLFFFFEEARGSVPLSQQAKSLNKAYDTLEKADYCGVVFGSGNDFEEKQQARRIRWKV
ncbi:hypothetical protein BDV28DRAFT_134828 [Aspergillus coremiiformis]|uniref:Major facilitator superfamily domain-containing protein n=1 Tax=Aspergillus coremiiformis TaxID=138285 RepID=A0A5N6Z666_9EURO|nr:hypothetical protein BDV28DRAFT_134828 [Aspergillus coremiiformis]